MLPVPKIAVPDSAVPVTTLALPIGKKPVPEGGTLVPTEPVKVLPVPKIAVPEPAAPVITLALPVGKKPVPEGGRPVPAGLVTMLPPPVKMPPLELVKGNGVKVPTEGACVKGLVVTDAVIVEFTLAVVEVALSVPQT
jgi:hypothetical protein